MSVLDYGDIIYMHTAASTLKPLDAVFYCTLGFIKRWVGPLYVRREQHSLLFIYKALLEKLPTYLTTLVKATIEYTTRAQDWIEQEVPRMASDLGRDGSRFFAPQMWIMLQGRLRLDCLLPFRECKTLVGNDLSEVI